MPEIVIKYSLSSTNAYAKKLADSGKNAVVVALKQTQGKGRLGRKWFSPKGGLWFSVILRPKSASLIPVMASLAILRSLKKLGVKGKLKWPNDVYVNGKKICGILSESSFSQSLEYVVVGIGINTNFPLEKLPKELRKTATTLMEEGVGANNMELLESVLLEIKSLMMEKKTKIIREWIGNAMRKVSINSEKLSVGGLTDEGYLVAKDLKGRKKIITEGDIRLRRPF